MRLTRTFAAILLFSCSLPIMAEQATTEEQEVMATEEAVVEETETGWVEYLGLAWGDFWGETKEVWGDTKTTVGGWWESGKEMVHPTEEAPAAEEKGGCEQEAVEESAAPAEEPTPAPVAEAPAPAVEAPAEPAASN